MRGAVAAGHPLTAGAGARVVAAGGNAVDACVAAAFVSWVCESMLTGPGGGGFMLVHDASDGKTRLLDFFVAVPERVEGPDELLALAVDFDGDTQQVFTPAQPRSPCRGRHSGSRPRTVRSGRCRGRSSSRPLRSSRATASS